MSQISLPWVIKCDLKGMELLYNPTLRSDASQRTAAQVSEQKQTEESMHDTACNVLQPVSLKNQKTISELVGVQISTLDYDTRLVVGRRFFGSGFVALITLTRRRKSA